MAWRFHRTLHKPIQIIIFPAQWFYGLLRALPGDHALLTPSPALLLADLTPALGRQNDTTWPYASASFVRLALARLTPPRPPHPARARGGPVGICQLQLFCCALISSNLESARSNFGLKSHIASRISR